MPRSDLNSAQAATTISRLAKKLHMKPERLARRAKELGLPVAANADPLTDQEAAILELTRNAPIGELATRRMDLEKGYVVPLSPDSDAASDSTSIRITSWAREGDPPFLPEAGDSAGTHMFDEAQEEVRQDRADDVSVIKQTVSQLTKDVQTLRTAAEGEHDLLRSRIESIDLAVQNLNGTIGRVKESVEFHELQIEELSSTVDAINHRLAIINRQLERPPWPARFRDLQARVRGVVTAKSASRSPRWPEQPRRELMDKLRARGFVISDETVARIWTGLQSARIVVLQGAPGTGKSTLAKLLPEVLLPPFGEHSRTFVRMDKDLTYEVAIGGRTITGDDHIGPELGFLSEALVACHESADGHWLVIDEFNRGDSDAMLTPILDALSAEHGTIEHPHMFPDESRESAILTIPASFRIIGTMNQLDQRLWNLSWALRERVAFVDIPPLPFEEETQLVMRKAIEPWLATGPRHQLRDAATQLSVMFCSIARNIRALTGREPHYQFAPCALGSRIIVDTVKGALYLLESAPESIGDALASVIDQQVSDRILVSLRDVEPAVLEALLSEVFSIDRFPLTCRRLRDWLGERGVD
jgi:MoxR-like ATPase